MSDMKLIMENFRAFTEANQPKPFPLLEQYERKTLTEAQLFEAWERQTLLEMQEVFNEGLLDTLKQGYEALKAGAKEEWEIVKDAFGAAMEKINDFLASVVFQALELMRKTKDFLEPVSKMILKVWNKVKVFCSAHPLLCKVITILLVMLAAICLMAASAHAADVTQGGVELDQTGLDTLKGVLYKLGEHDMEEEVAAKAIQLINQAQRAQEATELSQVVGQTGDMIREANDLIAAATDSPEGGPILKRMAEVGSKIVMSIGDFGLEATVGP